jgi:hypothetical protein
MATLVAVRHNPVLKACYERLLAVGKRKKVCSGQVLVDTGIGDFR